MLPALLAVLGCLIGWAVTINVLVNNMRLLRTAERVTASVSRIEKARKPTEARALYQAYFTYPTPAGGMKEVADTTRSNRPAYAVGQQIELLVPRDSAAVPTPNNFSSLWLGGLIACAISVVITIYLVTLLINAGSGVQ